MPRNKWAVDFRSGIFRSASPPAKAGVASSRAMTAVMLRLKIRVDAKASNKRFIVSMVFLQMDAGKGGLRVCRKTPRRGSTTKDQV